MKKIGLICTTVLICGSLAACGNTSSKQTDSSSRNSSKSVKVVKRHKKANSSSKNRSSSSSTQNSNASSSSQSGKADMNDPRNQALEKKGLLNADGTLTRNGRDLEAMMTGSNLDQSDWNDSDYTESYTDEGGVQRVPIYGNSNTNNNPQSNASTAWSAAPE